MLAERELIVKTYNPTDYLIIEVEWKPVSTNNLKKYRTIRKWGKNIVISYPSPVAKKFKEKALPQLLKQVGEKKRKPTNKCLVWQLEIFFCDARHYDSDNYEKFAKDLLEGIIYENDKQVINMRPYINKKSDREWVIYHLRVVDDA